MNKMWFPFPALFLSVLLFPAVSQAQNSGLAQRMKTEVEFLADDRLEGREAGTPGELLAADFIAKQFEEMGLQPLGTNSQYTQPFEFFKGKIISPESFLQVNGKAHELEKDWLPTVYSGNATAKYTIIDVGYGIQAEDQNHLDYAGKENLAGKAVVMELGSPDGVHPHSKFKAHTDIQTKIDLALKMGAGAIIFVNNDPNLPAPETNLTRKATSSTIPVLYFPAKKPADLAGAELNIDLTLTEEFGTGYNIAGAIMHESNQTIVIGGHYDHLGYGHQGSLYRGEPAIHNGADDNASGTAMVIELARYIKENGPNNMNFIFLAFSGEEKGLLGSNYWVKNPTYPLSDIRCMLNFDMVGRLEPTDKTIAIAGSGTSPFWKDALENIAAGGLKIKTSESGVGPSDHTSFYLKDIPVLHFFTGTHSDYHKPSDDIDKINYDGMVRVYDYVNALIEKIAAEKEIPFSKTQDSESGKAPKFSVTLGVVPDYLYSGEGMKLDGVSDGKPAQKAKLQAGDIIHQMGDVKITDMMSYMRALGQFEKGQKTTVLYERNGKMRKAKVQF